MTSNTEKLKDAGLKVTHPRSKILELFQGSPGNHFSAEDIHLRLVKKNEGIGLATVYRVLTQLEIAGLIQKNQFNETQSNYELKKDHHDHLICTRCGKIVEFIDADIERLQEKVSSKYKFTLRTHVMTLFGECHDEKCKERQKGK
ncbi:MAG: ferric iron uptake transcriptional regulator [Pseudomonadota bacterium]|nr:ferric iron uptake transcriptional regulator [Pseudomonadota bacterium]